MLRHWTVVALLFLTVAPGLPAQDSGSNPPRPDAGRAVPRVGGTITSVEGQTITLKTFRGTAATVKTTEGTAFLRGGQVVELSDLKVGETILVAGEEKDGVWIAKIVRLPPEASPAPQDLGKRFISGVVKKIDETRLTILRPDGESQVIEVDESTSFRNQKSESITLADIKTGDHVFGRGAVKNGVFVPQLLNLGDFSRRARPGFRDTPPDSAPSATGKDR
jgi:hypothetical protein